MLVILNQDHPAVISPIFLKSVEIVEATFRVAGKIPEIWNAEKGKTGAASYSRLVASEDQLL